MRRCDRQKGPAANDDAVAEQHLDPLEAGPLGIILRPADQNVLDVIRMVDDVGRGLARQRLDLADVSEALEQLPDQGEAFVVRVDIEVLGRPGGQPLRSLTVCHGESRPIADRQMLDRAAHVIDCECTRRTLID
jgi:hypothetical protein